MNAIDALIEYALDKELIEPCEKIWAKNTVLDALKLDQMPDLEMPESSAPKLHEILDVLLDDAFTRGVIPENTTTYRDLLDTEIMGRLAPRPSEVIQKFNELFSADPESATDWYYKFSQDTNYIRRDRMAKDLRWKADTEYGELDITINLSKPEKDPKAIAAAKNLPASDYPRCMLCSENEGYAGRINYPARQNHRIVPVKVDGMDWFLQYSPYTYYNEHCIVFNSRHVPMKIDRACFRKLLSFISQFPHYFVGSNADLPIVGGSILAHDHFQGGRYTFAMAKAPVETPFTFPGFEDVKAGIVKWPMSVIRITSPDPERLTELADRILVKWRGYTDEDAVIFSETDGVPHNTITPIARRRGTDYELDLVLRNNLTTPENPLGLYHPHAELHHIKKENIGLIEVMGLAVLPGRLKEELTKTADVLAKSSNMSDDDALIALRSDPLTEKHAEWAIGLRSEYTFSEENAWEIIQKETGKVFAKVLEHAGVYKRTPEGKEAFLKFMKEI